MAVGKTPWNVMVKLLILKDRSPDLKIQELNFSMAEFLFRFKVFSPTGWTHQMPIPLLQWLIILSGWMNRAEFLWVWFGLAPLQPQDEVFTAINGWTDCLTMQVCFKVDLPLCLGFTIKSMPDQDLYISISYKRLVDFWYKYGQLTHLQNSQRPQQITPISLILSWPHLKATHSESQSWMGKKSWYNLNQEYPTSWHPATEETSLQFTPGLNLKPLPRWSSPSDGYVGKVQLQDHWADHWVVLLFYIHKRYYTTCVQRVRKYRWHVKVTLLPSSR